MKDTLQDPVLKAAQKVQAMPPLRRALLAREALIRAVGTCVSFGPREARLRKILAWTGRGGMVATSLVLLAKRYFAGRVIASDSELPEAIFVGIAAMREQMLIEDIKVNLGEAPHFVDQRTPHGFAELPSPSLFRVLRHWFRSTQESLAILSEPEPDFATIDLLSTLTMRTHELAYLLALFEQLFESRPNLPIFCSTADLPAHAACLVGFNVEYRQHGFLARALVFPGFSVMSALTAYEGRYVADRIPGVALRLDAPNTAFVPVSATLAVAGDYLARDPALVTSLVEMALANNFNVVVRPHPRGYEELWSGVSNRENVVFDTGGRFEDFLTKWQPGFVASWFSTTLLDGLLAGAVPITLSRDNGVLLLPIEAIALSWPDQGALIKCCMCDNKERRRVHESLLENLRL